MSSISRRRLPGYGADWFEATPWMPWIVPRRTRLSQTGPRGFSSGWPGRRRRAIHRLAWVKTSGLKVMAPRVQPWCMRTWWSTWPSSALTSRDRDRGGRGWQAHPGGKECAGGPPGRGVATHRDQRRYGDQRDHLRAAGRIAGRSVSSRAHLRAHRRMPLIQGMPSVKSCVSFDQRFYPPPRFYDQPLGAVLAVPLVILAARDGAVGRHRSRLRRICDMFHQLPCLVLDGGELASKCLARFPLHFAEEGIGGAGRQILDVHQP